MTGMILAIARGAGEVAPLMLVGAMKSAPELPIDGIFPFVHPQRSFMHLGFHLYDLGFHSQNSEAARPMVFTTALLLDRDHRGLEHHGGSLAESTCASDSEPAKPKRSLST